jgi:hypothetical protein
MENQQDEINVYDWLNDYHKSLKDMDSISRASEDRRDYQEPSQTYQDYLDYVEEWEWHQKHQKHLLLQSYILYASKTHQTINCTCEKIHKFTQYSDLELGDTCIDYPNTPIYGKCWYQYLSTEVDRVLDIMTQPRIRATQHVERVMVEVAQWRMMDQNLSPYLLPFDAFKQMWWDREANGSMSKNSIWLKEQLTIQERKRIEIEQDLNSVPISKHKRMILLHFPESDHGLHILRQQLSQDDFNRIWGFMNKARSKIDWKARISIETLYSKENKCSKCKKKIGFNSVISPFGIYYAPPGVGKTTALNKGEIVAFDTDWIGLGPNWRDYSPLLRMNIPIITNQYTAFKGSGLKVIGVVKERVRLDAEGNPFTTLKQLKEYENDHPQDVTFIEAKDEEYFSNYATQLKLIQHLNKMIIGYAINTLPFYRNEQTPEWARKYPSLIRKELGK